MGSYFPSLDSASKKGNRIIKISTSLSLIALILIIVCGTTACAGLLSDNSSKLSFCEEKALTESEKEVKSLHYKTMGDIVDVTSKVLYVHDNGDSMYDFIVGVQISQYYTFALCHVKGDGIRKTATVLRVTDEYLGSGSFDEFPQSFIDEAKVMWKID